MTDLTLFTFDWVPEKPRGFVRDLRVRWALEEAGLPYDVESVPFQERSAEHLAQQPFGQVPWLTDGDLSIFETGAILLHLGERSAKLMPTDPKGRNDVIKWMFAALNSVEPMISPWALLVFFGETEDTPAWRRFNEIRDGRLTRMETVLAARDWLAENFSIADIQMAETLRMVDSLGGLGDYPACRGYVARATARPSFKKAHADQLAHFAAADAAQQAAK